MAAVNPKVLYVPSGGLRKMQLKAVASATWKKGEFCDMTSNQVDVCDNDDIPYGIFAETQATATSANDLVEVYVLEVGTILEMCVETSGSAAAETAVNVGVAYDLGVASNIHYIASDATTDKVFKVLEKGSDYNSAQFTSTQTPGRVKVRVLKTA